MTDHLTHAPIDLAQAFAAPRDDCGATVAFVGTVRDNHAGRTVDGLDYSAHEPSAEAELQAICTEAQARFDIAELRILHRLGELQLGDSAVLLVCRAGHRDRYRRRTKVPSRGRRRSRCSSTPPAKLRRRRCANRRRPRNTCRARVRKLGAAPAPGSAVNPSDRSSPGAWSASWAAWSWCDRSSLVGRRHSLFSRAAVRPTSTDRTD